MTNSNPLKAFVKRITTLFPQEKILSDHRKKEECEKQKYIRLNFFLLTAALEDEKKDEKKRCLSSLFSIFNPDVLALKNPDFLEMIKQADSCCTRQDLHLFPFKQFFLRNEFAMRQVIEWRLSKYIKSKEQLDAFVKVMKETPPDVFRHHLVTLITEEGPKWREEIDAKMSLSTK